MNLHKPIRGDKFALGRIAYTQGVERACTPEFMVACLKRHAQGDWGVMVPPDREVNDQAMASGGRLHSAYAIDETLLCRGFGDNCLWIITEVDRSVTTLLLPAEY
jgi:hypothetical protein